MAIHSQLSGVAPPPVCRIAQPYGPNMKTHVADNSSGVTINSVAGPRRKFVDEGRLRKVSERLFSDTGQQRSMRLAGESVNTNSSTSVFSGNGINHSAKYFGGSKSSSVVSRSVTIQKGQSWASENADEVHLKEDMKLSYLAQDLISTDRLAPQSWCAMGNCYSLQKDHETALKNFQRSVQCVVIYVALEDFENGIKSYQSALRVDSNAWHGLGMVYLRQEKYEFSEHHFRMAFQINPLSPVIMSYLGTALHALKRNNEAPEMMERAVLEALEMMERRK
ncbi:hypothetical protein OROGR_004872 [Orobanche gracilis]